MSFPLLAPVPETFGVLREPATALARTAKRFMRLG